MKSKSRKLRVHDSKLVLIVYVIFIGMFLFGLIQHLKRSEEYYANVNV